MSSQQREVEAVKEGSPKAALLAATTACIRKLAQEPSIVDETRRGASSQQKQTSPNDTLPPVLDDIVDQYAPKCLERQFRELYSALQPALASNTHNAAAILQGHRGTGKSLLLQQVLAACRPYHTFRVVYVNGITVPGGSIARVVREMLRQLCAEDAVGSSDEDSEDETNDTTTTVTPPHRRGNNSKRRRTARTKLRRLKQTSFTNQLQFLNELMQIARIDGIPILFVLDELDTFLGENNSKDGRQLLLYHLLDRVASDGSLCSCVGLTCHTGFLTRLEKRIQSRAEGTTRFIYTGPPPSYDALVRTVLLPDDGDDSQVQTAILQHAPWERQYRMGRPVRWFRARLYRAMVLYRYQLEQCSTDDDSPAFDASTLDDDDSTTTATITNDWTGPEVAMVLAARRLLVRGATPSLTIQAMIHEYRSSFQRYSPPLLHQTCLNLLERGVLRPAHDHTGTGPFLYRHDDNDDYDDEVLQATPLHLTMDIHRDVKRALDTNTISSCSTALREWGRRSVG